MGCEMSSLSPPDKFHHLINQKEKVYSYIQIYLVSSNEYGFYGIVPPDGEEFYLVFQKEHEERIPIAISFEISEMNHICNQYQMIRFCSNDEYIEKQNIIIDFPKTNLSNYYYCPISPRFPFTIEIYGSVQLKN
jgi:hypothetical protein